jgi:hypothetical protein
MVGIGGLFKNNGIIDVIEHLLSECAFPYVENEVVKIHLIPSKSLRVVPKEKAFYDYVYDLIEQKVAIIYRYIPVGDRIMSAREVMSMDENEFYGTLEKADGSFLIIKAEEKKYG